MSPERVILIILAAVAAAAIVAALMLADRKSWPSAILAGLLSGAAVLWALLSWLSANQ